jgi:CheY-like chemotaxis protein
MSPTPEAERHLHVLCLDDSPSDARLVRRVLTAAGYDLEMDLATERGRFEDLLASECYDVILADYRLPGFDARAAHELARVACPRTPFVGVSAIISEEVTAQLMRGGAVQSVLKGRLARLPHAVQRAMSEKPRRAE